MMAGTPDNAIWQWERRGRQRRHDAMKKPFNSLLVFSIIIFSYIFLSIFSGETDTRTLCNIECRGADRDSVISKVPSWTRECVRYFSYDTSREPLPKQFGNSAREWYLWRGGQCRLMEISLEVHCGFPWWSMMLIPNDFDVIIDFHWFLTVLRHLGIRHLGNWEAKMENNGNLGC